MKRLYPSHVPLSFLSRTTLTFAASVGAFLKPARADLVAAVAELTGTRAYEDIRNRMKQDVVGVQILNERPRITNDTIRRCAEAPDGSLGAAYHHFMSSRRFQADERPPVRFVDDEELAYVATRIREVHDFWHVIFDCHTDIFGETALKGLEFVQTGLPMTAAAVMAGQSKMKPEQRAVLTTQFFPWAARAGGQCHNLLCIYYEHHLGDDLEGLRRKWRIITAPNVIVSTPHQEPASQS